MGETILTYIGKRIKQLRLERQLTMEKLAQACGVTSRYLSQLEAGEANVSINKLESVCKALEVEIGHIVPTEDQVTQIAQKISSSTHRELISDILKEVLSTTNKRDLFLILKLIQEMNANDQS